MNFKDFDKIKPEDIWNDGEPCEHKGCLNHITHPCEGCGRIAGRGDTLKVKPLRWFSSWQAENIK